MAPPGAPLATSTGPTFDGTVKLAAVPPFLPATEGREEHGRARFTPAL